MYLINWQLSVLLSIQTMLSVAYCYQDHTSDLKVLTCHLQVTCSLLYSKQTIFQSTAHILMLILCFLGIIVLILV